MNRTSKEELKIQQSKKKNKTTFFRQCILLIGFIDERRDPPEKGKRKEVCPMLWTARKVHVIFMKEAHKKHTMLA